MKNMNTPNRLTIVRMVLVPVFLVFLLYWNRYAALVAFVLACLTDFIDGRISRKYNLITTFGKFMDPLADKLLVTTAMICFACAGQLSVWIPIVVVARDLAVDGLRMIASSRNIVLAAGWSGKVKTAVTMLAIIAMLTPLGNFGIFNLICGIIIVILNLISLIDYFRANGSILLEQK